MSTIRALVTGATGFLGKHLLPVLSAENCRIDAASIPGDNLPYDFNYVDQVYSFDIRDAESVRKCLSASKPDLVFHLAALLRGGSLSEMLDVNAVGTDNLLAAAQRLKPVPTVIIPGSAAEYGYQANLTPIKEETPLKPVSIYGISKAAQVLTGLSYAAIGLVPVIVGRIFNMLGPAEPVTMLCGTMADQISSAESANQACILKVGDLSGYRDFLDVRDVARGLWFLWLKGKSGGVYNICSGKARHIHSVVDQFARYARVPVTTEQDPAKIRGGEITYCRGNPDKITRDTKWGPEYIFEDSVFDTLYSWRVLKGCI